MMKISLLTMMMMMIMAVVMMMIMVMMMTMMMVVMIMMMMVVMVMIIMMMIKLHPQLPTSLSTAIYSTCKTFSLPPKHFLTSIRTWTITSKKR